MIIIANDIVLYALRARSGKLSETRTYRVEQVDYLLCDNGDASFDHGPNLY